MERFPFDKVKPFKVLQDKLWKWLQNNFRWCFCESYHNTFLGFPKTSPIFREYFAQWITVTSPYNGQYGPKKFLYLWDFSRNYYLKIYILKLISIFLFIWNIEPIKFARKLSLTFKNCHVNFCFFISKGLQDRIS